MLDLLWKLFNKTGNIKYYNLLVKLRSEVNEKRYDDKDPNRSSNSRSSNNYDNKLQ